MQKRNPVSVPYLLAYLAIFLLARLLSAESITSYSWLSEYETTEQGEIIWFWSADTFWGPVRSNDYIGIRYSPSFHDHVITSQNEFRYYQPGHVHFEFQPTFNAPPFQFPDSLPHLRERADPIIGNRDNQYITTIRLLGNEGLDVYQRRIGLEGADSLILHLEDPDGRIIFVDGPLEMEGIVAGRYTIVAAGNIGLLDDVRYIDAVGELGLVDPFETQSMLGIVSEGDIIVRDTEANGKENGGNREEDNLQLSSIVINAALVALQGSFTFEHQNEDWDTYQGPTPDYRGSIFLSGSLTQHRRGYLHRSHHTGTGYGKSSRFDRRLLQEFPPGLEPENLGTLGGNFDRLVLNQGPYRLTSATFRTLVVTPGVDLTIDGTLTVSDTLQLLGESDRPITIHSGEVSPQVVVQDNFSFVEVFHTTFDQGIEVNFSARSINLQANIFQSNVILQGNSEVDSCVFKREVTANAPDFFRTSTSIYGGGLSIIGDRASAVVRNCDFVATNGSGLLLRGNLEADLRNNIFALNRTGIANNTRAPVSLAYNCFYENLADQIDCQIGVGNVFDDPLMIDYPNGDYRLEEGSPCIDAGDPESPLDPDGTRSDIGAIYFHHPNRAGELSLRPSALILSSYPNPFNSRTTISYSIPVSGWTRIDVVDLNGRVVARLSDGWKEAGSYREVLNGGGLASGQYLIRCSNWQTRLSEPIILVK